MRLERMAVASMLLMAAVLVGLGTFLTVRFLQPSPGPQFLVVGVIYGVGAVGLRRRRGWGFVIAGLLGIIGTILSVLLLLFVAASLAYYDWDPDISVLGPGLTTYPSLAIIVALVLAHVTIAVAVFQRASRRSQDTVVRT